MNKELDCQTTGLVQNVEKLQPCHYGLMLLAIPLEYNKKWQKFDSLQQDLLVILITFIMVCT